MAGSLIAGRRVPLLLLLLAVALAARIATFGNPLILVDEQFYLLVARAMLDGQLPYVDIWDRKPIGLFLLYLPAALLPAAWAVIAYQLLALGFVVATALLIRRFVQKAGWRDGATPAAIFYILWLNLGQGQGGQSPIFYNLFMIAAALMTLRALHPTADDRARLHHALAAMALVGIAIQIKYTVLFEGVAFGLLLTFAEWRASKRIGRTLIIAVALILVALLPTIMAGLYYLHVGQLNAYIYANFLSILSRSGQPPGVARNALMLALILLPGLAMALWPSKARTATTEQSRVHSFLLLWLAVAAGAVILFGTYFPHYGLPVMLPAACCAGRFMAVHRRWRNAMIGTVAIAGQIVILLTRGSIGTGAELRPIVQAIGKGPGRLYVYSGPTALYLFTGRRGATRYIFPAHLKQMSEASAIGVSQQAELTRLLATRPEWIVSKAAQSDESPARRAQLDATIAAHYRRVGTWKVGRSDLSAFHLRR